MDLIIIIWYLNYYYIFYKVFWRDTFSVSLIKLWTVFDLGQPKLPYISERKEFMFLDYKKEVSLNNLFLFLVTDGVTF